MEYSLFRNVHQSVKLSPLLQGPEMVAVARGASLFMEKKCWVS
ncbi:hypothetical protein O4H66_19100 [Comamonadaceae bacterium G21597-S1]|nr:hypothetical protein [Comamonadaceae bacterium G21597-S1]